MLSSQAIPPGERVHDVNQSLNKKCLLDLCPRANWIGSTKGFDGFDPLGY
jgi:hypothetical protein